MTARVLTTLALLLAGAPQMAGAADLYGATARPGLASDRNAQVIGDSLTVLIIETSSATNSTQRGSKKATRLAGQITAGTSLNESAQLNLGGSFDGAGQSGRAGRLVAQISIVVDGVLPNGDLHVAGEQVLNIDGERMRIRLKGRVRRADISADNTVLSSRLADVVIDYDGKGFVSRGSKPGVITRIFDWLGLP